jgi:thioredoxin 2
MSDIVCPACQAINRVPDDKPARDGHCGRCHAPLFDGHPIHLDDQTFARHVAKNSIPIVVDFWADWCGPCKMMAPEFQKAANVLEPKLRFAKLDTEASQQAAASLGIRSIPTMILFRGGHEIARQSGAMPAGHIVQWINESLKD